MKLYRSRIFCYNVPVEIKYVLTCFFTFIYRFQQFLFRESSTSFTAYKFLVDTIEDTGKCGFGILHNESQLLYCANCMQIIFGLLRLIFLLLAIVCCLDL